MELELMVNERPRRLLVRGEESLLEALRKLGFASVRSGCETTNCGICTVWVDEKPVLSCSYPALRCAGRRITTLEGVRQKAEAFLRCMAEEGADQCGYCSPGFVMTVLAMERELENPTEAEISAYLAGNLCRCTGYTSHMRALRRYLGGERA